jgi:hypothetical protein
MLTRAYSDPDGARRERERWRVLRSSRVRGRKPHACTRCGTPIAVGEEHYHSVGFLDGMFCVTRLHDYCPDQEKA